MSKAAWWFCAVCVLVGGAVVCVSIVNEARLSQMARCAEICSHIGVSGFGDDDRRCSCVKGSEGWIR